MSHRLILVFIATAALVVAGCGGGTTATAGVGSPAPAGSVPPASSDAGAAACAATADAGTIQASMAGRAFTPATIQAKVGDVIAWTNTDSLSHTATVDSDEACTTEVLATGESGALTFSTAGTYPFHCQVHPDMKGTIEVTS